MFNVFSFSISQVWLGFDVQMQRQCMRYADSTYAISPRMTVAHAMYRQYSKCSKHTNSSFPFIFINYQAQPVVSSSWISPKTVNAHQITIWAPRLRINRNVQLQHSLSHYAKLEKLCGAIHITSIGVVAAVQLQPAKEWCIRITIYGICVLMECSQVRFALFPFGEHCRFAVISRMMTLSMYYPVCWWLTWLVHSLSVRFRLWNHFEYYIESWTTLDLCRYSKNMERCECILSIQFWNHTRHSYKWCGGTTISWKTRLYR